MSYVKEKLQDLTETVIEHFGLSDDPETFCTVEELIMKHSLLSENSDVIEFFRDNIICPECRISLDGPKCTCFTQDR